MSLLPIWGWAAISLLIFILLATAGILAGKVVEKNKLLQQQARRQIQPSPPPPSANQQSPANGAQTQPPAPPPPPPTPVPTKWWHWKRIIKILFWVAGIGLAALAIAIVWTYRESVEFARPDWLAMPDSVGRHTTWLEENWFFLAMVAVFGVGLWIVLSKGLHKKLANKKVLGVIGVILAILVLSYWSELTPFVPASAHPFLFTVSGFVTRNTELVVIIVMVSAVLLITNMMDVKLLIGLAAVILGLAYFWQPIENGFNKVMYTIERATTWTMVDKTNTVSPRQANCAVSTTAVIDDYAWKTFWTKGTCNWKWERQRFGGVLEVRINKDNRTIRKWAADSSPPSYQHIEVAEFRLIAGSPVTIRVHHVP